MVMKRGSKILGLLLIRALLIAALPPGSLHVEAAVADINHWSAPPAVLGESPAACHAHQSLPVSPLPNSPVPAPADYACCITGHDAAVVPASTSQQPPAQRTPVSPQIGSLPAGYFVVGLEGPLVRFADPPGTTRLRI
jgi:hypothetical protein